MVTFSLGINVHPGRNTTGAEITEKINHFMTTSAKRILLFSICIGSSSIYSNFYFIIIKTMMKRFLVNF
ncbi:hypothetical protein CpB0411 [Chlamydia pneumoniae TW-183]|uniref:Uncharacterized protein n=1 Tax=Chlamydia pneumoniae TaxID=83558 RepID=A0ABM5LCG4_CHLPN|nr:hypothetical protein CpB0411 [Chlamydia pneumoniae TW-183]